MFFDVLACCRLESVRPYHAELMAGFNETGSLIKAKSGLVVYIDDFTSNTPHHYDRPNLLEVLVEVS